MSLNRGIKIFTGRKRYKVMHEALWGLNGALGLYFHDDFLVDGASVKNEDLLLYSRGVPTEETRLRAYRDAIRSPHGHCDLKKLAMGAKPLFSRILPKYVIAGTVGLLKETRSVHYSLFYSVFLCFLAHAVFYEKLFSNYEVGSELGHNYFSPGHIAESIICQGYKVRYCMMHWSDTSTSTNRYVTSNLGCDRYLVWGSAHVTGLEGEDRGMLQFTGYVFKNFVNRVRSDRGRILAMMGIRPGRTVVSFFDESFGSECKMTEDHFVNFWNTAMVFAENHEDCTIIMKPKDSDRHEKLSGRLKERYSGIRSRMEALPNVCIIVPQKWTFIEAVGVSDIVVTQGPTTSATIAIICGINGFYICEHATTHPFMTKLKDVVMFDDHGRLLEMLDKVASGKEDPVSHIPSDIKRQFDAFDDDRALERFRDVLAGRAAEAAGG